MFGLDAVEELMKSAAGAVRDDSYVSAEADLLADVGTLERIRRLVDACEARLLTEIEAGQVSEAEVGLTTAVWLSQEAGVPRSVASKRVKVARALRSPLGEVDAALVDGRLSWDQARVIVEACRPRIADEMAAVQGELIEAARAMPFLAWQREVAGLVDLVDQDGGHDPADDLARNKLALVPTFEGITHVGGQLTGEHGAIARQAVETVADELFRAFARDREACPDLEIPSRATLLALAFVELCKRGLATDLDTTVPPRPDVTVVVRAETPERAETADGMALPPEVTRLFGCDADVTRMIIDADGVPLHLGRSTRLASAAQRRALRVRDGGCVFPGCDATTHWCEAHHVHEWEHGGGTDLANLALLCRRHHGITHRRGWAMHANDTGWFTWTTPTGRTLHSQRHHRQPPAQAA